MKSLFQILLKLILIQADFDFFKFDLRWIRIFDFQMLVKTRQKIVTNIAPNASVLLWITPKSSAAGALPQTPLGWLTLNVTYSASKLPWLGFNCFKSLSCEVFISNSTDINTDRYRLILIFSNLILRWIRIFDFQMLVKTRQKIVTNIAPNASFSLWIIPKSSAAGAPPQTPLGELTALPQTP